MKNVSCLKACGTTSAYTHFRVRYTLILVDIIGDNNFAIKSNGTFCVCARWYIGVGAATIAHEALISGEHRHNRCMNGKEADGARMITIMHYQLNFPHTHHSVERTA